MILFKFILKLHSTSVQSVTKHYGTKVFHIIKTVETVPNTFYEAAVTQKQKSHKYSIKKEKCRTTHS